MLSMTAMLLLSVAQPQQAQALAIEPDTVVLEVEQSRTLRVRSSGAGALPVRWFAQDPEIASVDESGRVTAHRPGTARVGALVGDALATAVVRVPALPPATVEAALPAPTLRAGTSAPVTVTARDRLGGAVDPDALYESDAPAVARVDETGRVFALAPGDAVITVRAGAAEARVSLRVVARGAAEVRIEPARERVRTGDVVRLRARLGDEPLYPAWSVDGAGASVEAEGADGVFVAERPGTYRVTALVGDELVRSAILEVEPRGVEGRLTAVGHGLGSSTHHFGDTWAFTGVDGRDYAYIGTFMYDWMKVWDVTDPSNPVLTDSLRVDARRINDVKIHPTKPIGIITREGASSRRNGIVLLDLSTPSHPRILSEYTETVTGGVHNVWIRGELDLVYAVHNGTSDVHIIDIANPTAPREVGRWGLDRRGGKVLHDVIVQDGYAYVSYWDDGLVILDVGAGTHGGTPTTPTFVSQFKYPQGHTHVAWRYGDYVFVGDEIFPADWDADRPIEARGYIHVVDVRDIDHPREVAKYEVPEAGAHNVWVEDDRLYVGYYQAGLRVVDVSGELRGDLYRQGREIGWLKTYARDAVTPNWSMTWGAQIHKGHIFTSDLNSGLWVAKLEEPTVVF